MRKIHRLYALAGVAVFVITLVGGLTHNLAVGVVFAIGVIAALLAASKYIEDPDA
jgi:hypothetical protein